MALVLNIIWICTLGWITALGWLIVGLLQCITIIGIPSGVYALKMAKLTLAPFGKDVEYGGGAASFVINVIWLVLGGAEMALGYLVAGAILCITIVGIPFGLQLFKIAKLSLMPFGAKIE